MFVLQAVSLSAIFSVVSSGYYLISTTKWKKGIITLETSVNKAVSTSFCRGSAYLDVLVIIWVSNSHQTGGSNGGWITHPSKLLSAFHLPFFLCAQREL